MKKNGEYAERFKSIVSDVVADFQKAGYKGLHFVDGLVYYKKRTYSVDLENNETLFSVTIDEFVLKSVYPHIIKARLKSIILNGDNASNMGISIVFQKIG